MIFGRKAFRTILIFIMAAALVGPVAFTNLPSADALVPQFKELVIPPPPNLLDLPDLSTDVRYLAVGPTHELLFKVIDPDNPSELLNPPSVTVENSPPGFSLTQDPLFRDLWKVIWVTSDFATDSEFTYQSFLVTFAATEQGSSSETSEISIPFLLFKEDLFEPTVTLDKESYLAGDTAYVTIFDPRKNLDGKNVESEAPLEKIIANREPGGSFDVWEVDVANEPTVRSGTFRTSLVVSESFTITYPTGDSFVQIGPIEVSAIGVKTDKEKYSTGADARIIAVTSGDNQPDELLVDTNIVPINWVDNAVGFQVVPDITLSSPGEHTISISLDGATYSIVVRVEDISAMLVSTNTLGQRYSYYSNETAAVAVTNHQLNEDRTKAETRSGLLTVRTLDAAVPIDLIETGIDTGIFTGMHLIGFTTETNPDPQSKQVRINPIPGDRTDLILQYQDELLPSGSVEVHADVVTASFEEGNDGIGDASGAPIAAASIVSVTNLSCASYGGDAERDGICDGWEAPTKTYLTIPYGGQNHVFSYWCDPDCPHSSNDDILLEIDYQSGQGPTANVLPDIKTTFDQRGYKLHYRIDDAISLPADNYVDVWSDPSSGGENDCGTIDSFWEIKLNYFGENGSVNERLRPLPIDTCSDTGTVNNRGAALKQVVHYCFYSRAAEQKWSLGAVGTSGISEAIGNDCLVTLGNFDPIDQNKEKGTLMHELGHMFGLRHGGGVNSITANPLTWIADSNANCKPNYISPMSYSHQFPNALGSITLQAWTYSYSNSLLPNYDTTSPSSSPPRLSEEQGPVPTSGTVDIAWAVGGAPYDNKAISAGDSGADDDVDWNGWGGIQSDPPTEIWNAEVNNFGFRDCDSPTIDNAPNGIIRGFKDWPKLILEMRVHGGSNWNVPGSFRAEDNELNYTVWRQIIESGIKVLNNKVQLLDSSAFSDPQSANATKEEIESYLVGTAPLCPPEVVVPMCDSSVVTHIEKKEFLEAIDRLAYVSTYYDGDEDDKITNSTAKASLFRSTEGNFKTLIMELLEKDDGAFGMAWTNGIETEIPDAYAVIMAESSTIDATEGRFFVHKKDPDNPSGNTITFTVKGEGSLGLELDRALVDGELSGTTVVLVDDDPISAHFSPSTRGEFFGSRIDFTIDGSGDQIHEVVIMGENVVPEFSAASALVLALAILAIITVTVVATRIKNGFGSSLSSVG